MSDKEIDEEKITELYKYILAEEVPEGDNYLKAMKLLKLGYVEHCVSRNSASGAILVANTIQQYRDIVDKEDYYAECREKYKHFPVPDLSRKPVPSKLLATDISEFCPPFPCAAKYEYCKELEVTDEDLKVFNDDYVAPDEVDEDDIDFDFDGFEKSVESCIEGIKSAKESTSKSVDEPTPSTSRLLNEFPKPSFTKQVSVNKDLPFNFNRSPQPCSSKSIDQNMEPSEDSSQKNPRTLKQSNLNAMFFKPQINRAPSCPVPSVTKEVPTLKKRKLSPPPIASPKSNLYPDFKSSLEELHLQNAKQNRNSPQQSTSYQPNPAGAMRKSVGLSKPFKVPLEAQQTTAQPEQPEPTNSPTDERLKNIDPKFVEMIQNEIIYSGKKVLWDDIAGLSYAKQIIKEAIILPLLRPDIFTGLRRAPKGILLYGPPGTGKTLIGKCIASQSKSTFFSISASALTSKWIGEGEKLVRALFAVARVHQPAVVFIDEIDSLLSQRSETEHESSRRLKTEFLVQLDGAATCEDDMVIVVAATNRPQELDEAARRRFTKRLYIPLPENEDRIVLLTNVLRNESVNLSIGDVEEISTLTEGFSGADLKNLCAEASMVSFREMSFSQITSVDKDDIRKTDLNDFKSALKRVRATVSPGDLIQYIKWNETFGSGKAST